MLAIISYSAKKSGVRKVIVHSHASVDTLTFKRKILRLVCNYFMSKTVDLYCACSVVAAKAKFVERKNVLIIKNGISLSNFIYDDGKRRCIRSSLNICNDNFVVGHVGRFSDEKNHEFLLNIFYSIWLSNHSSRLMLIGNGDLEDKTKDQVNALGIKDYVDFIGVVNNVYDYMQAMDCFILPSKFEGLGLVAVEAQAMGLPCYLADTVPKDVEITDLVHYISLAKTSEQWANEIISYPFKIRRNMCKSISQAGYDIKKVSQQMRNIYIS
jgi:glycosyltransferase involved in cell wall biosynthesis